MTQQRILVVDDEAPMRKLLSINLRASGYAVQVAADGSDVLRLIREHPFDLLLLDVNLPGLNGLALLEAVRQGAEMPVLIVSGNGRERDKAEALDLGADDYLVKPFAIAQLLGRVEALLFRVSAGTAGPADSVTRSGARTECIQPGEPTARDAAGEVPGLPTQGR